MDWRPTDTVPALDDDEVHVWSIRLLATAQQIARDAELLSADERTRADRFRLQHHRARFIVAHAQLRTILAAYLAAHPTDLRFTATPRGKPSLVGHAVSFNLSHSDDQALLAVSRERPLGVDTEHIHPLDDLDQIAQRYFCPAECHQLRALPHSERPSLFFTYWTRKEAILKATGDGLWTPLHEVDVSNPGPVLVRDGTGSLRTLTLLDLPRHSNHAAALAVEGPTPLLTRCLEWTKPA